MGDANARRGTPQHRDPTEGLEGSMITFGDFNRLVDLDGIGTAEARYYGDIAEPEDS